MLALAKDRHFPVEVIVRNRTRNVAGSVETLGDTSAEIREPDGLPVSVPYEDVKVVSFDPAAIERWLQNG